MEKITLSKVETFALVKAREQLAVAQNAMNEMIDGVATAHGIDVAERDKWLFNRDFTELQKVAKPPQENKPDE